MMMISLISITAQSSHLVLSSGAQLSSLLGYPGRVPAPLPLLLPLDVDSAGLPQPVHLVVHPLELLVPPVLQALPHLLVLRPARLERLQELKHDSWKLIRVELS